MKKVGLIKIIFQDFNDIETIVEIMPTVNGVFSVIFQYATGEWDVISGLVYDDYSVYYKRHGYNETRYKWFGLFGKYNEYVMKELKSERYE